MRSAVLMALLAALLLVPSATAGPAGTPGTSEEAPLQALVLELDQSRYPEVQIRFQVRRPGVEVLPLEAIREVRLVEGILGGPQVEVSGTRVEPLGHQPIRVLVLVDASGSMVARVGPAGERKIDATKRALVSLVELLQPGDQFALMTYHLEPGSYVERGERPGFAVRDHFELLSGGEYLADRAAMLEAVGRLEVPGGYSRYTNMFNAVATALEVDRQWRRPEDPVTQIVVMTDGIDNRADLAARVAAAGHGTVARAMGESLKADDVAARAREAGVVVHAIGFGNVAAQPRTDPAALRPEQLKRLAVGAYGRFLLAPDPGSLQELYRLMAADLRAGGRVRYTAPGSYRPGPDGGPEPRIVELRLLAGGRWVGAPLQRYTPAGVVGLAPAGGEGSDRQRLLTAGLMAAVNVGLLLAALLARGLSALLARRFLAHHRRMARIRFTPAWGAPPSEDDGGRSRGYHPWNPPGGFAPGRKER